MDRLDRAAHQILSLWRELEEDVLADMARRMAKAGLLTETARYQAGRLEQTRLFRSDLLRRLAALTGRSEEAIRALLAQVGTQTLQAGDEVLRAAGLTPPPLNDSPALRQMLTAGARQTNGTLRNLTATTAQTATGQFERALDRAWMQVASGAFDYQTATRRAVRALADRGLEAITYPTGHTDTVEVAVRRAVVTGLNQSAFALQLQRCLEMGCDLVEISAHPGARPSHAVYQGKVYSISGQSRDYPPLTATGWGTGPGLGGWNCRHLPFPFFEGISQPGYSQRQLQRYQAPSVPYGGRTYTRYEADQRQRALERRVRRYKRRYAAEEAAGLDTAETAQRLSSARRELQAFARATGGYVDASRTATPAFGRSQAGRAAWQNRRSNLDSSGQLYRRVKNTGDFEALEELMELKHVRSIVSEMGLDLEGTKIQIVRNKEMLSHSDVVGYTFPDGKVIQLYPNAFRNREQLVKTLGHEYIHLQQIRKHGSVVSTSMLNRNEAEAYASENGWWSDYVKKTGYRPQHSTME